MEEHRLTDSHREWRYNEMAELLAVARAKHPDRRFIGAIKSLCDECGFEDLRQVVEKPGERAVPAQCRECGVEVLTLWVETAAGRVLRPDCEREP